MAESIGSGDAPCVRYGISYDISFEGGSFARWSNLAGLYRLFQVAQAPGKETSRGKTHRKEGVEDDLPRLNRTEIYLLQKVWEDDVKQKGTQSCVPFCYYLRALIRLKGSFITPKSASPKIPPLIFEAPS